MIFSTSCSNLSESPYKLWVTVSEKSLCSLWLINSFETLAQFKLQPQLFSSPAAFLAAILHIIP